MSRKERRDREDKSPETEEGGTNRKLQIMRKYEFQNFLGLKGEKAYKKRNHLLASRKHFVNWTSPWGERWVPEAGEVTGRKAGGKEAESQGK